MDVVTGQPPDTARGAGQGNVLCCPVPPLEPPGVRESAAVRWYVPEPPAQRSLRPFGASPRLCCIMEHRGRQGIVKVGDLLLAQLGYLSAAEGRRATTRSKSSKWANKSWPICTMTNVRHRAMMEIKPIGPAGR